MTTTSPAPAPAQLQLPAAPPVRDFIRSVNSPTLSVPSPNSNRVYTVAVYNTSGVGTYRVKIKRQFAGVEPGAQLLMPNSVHTLLDIGNGNVLKFGGVSSTVIKNAISRAVAAGLDIEQWDLEMESSSYSLKSANFVAPGGPYSRPYNQTAPVGALVPGNTQVIIAPTGKVKAYEPPKPPETVYNIRQQKPCRYCGVALAPELDAYWGQAEGGKDSCEPCRRKQGIR